MHFHPLPDLLRKEAQRRDLHIGDTSDEEDDDRLLCLLPRPLQHLVIVLAAHESRDVSPHPPPALLPAETPSPPRMRSTSFAETGA